jgi:hypothetical protein
LLKAAGRMRLLRHRFETQRTPAGDPGRRKGFRQT